MDDEEKKLASFLKEAEVKLFGEKKRKRKLEEE